MTEGELYAFLLVVNAAAVLMGYTLKAIGFRVKGL